MALNIYITRWLIKKQSAFERDIIGQLYVHATLSLIKPRLKEINFN